MGHLGLKRTDPDRVVCDVMNLVLGGGGFTSRLTEVVRTRGGLAYDVGSFFTRQRDLGLFTASVQTKGETTWKAIGLILDEIRRIRDEPVPQEELDRAKDIFLNGLVFSYAQPMNLVESVVSLEYYGYPRDWLSRWRETVESITVEDVQRVAREYLHPDGLTIVIVGNPDVFDERPEGLPEPEILE
jgi:predicted Zn-dependent peptidase